MSTRIQPGFALYLTGLPSSGKTTLAHEVAERLSRLGVHSQVLDSDEMRQVLTPKPSYSPQERDWFYQTLAFIAGLLTDNGINVLIAATAPRRLHRETARAQIERFAAVYLHCPPEVCRERDPKGLWARADAGEITTLPGAGAPYETPESPEIWVDTTSLSVEQGAEQIIEHIQAMGWVPDPSELDVLE